MKQSINGRTGNVLKNAFWAFLSQLLISLLGLASRKVFLSRLGIELLGVNGLFSDVLLLLSFAELGIGAIIMFALYQPIAEGDTEKIRSLLKFYKTVYNLVIAIVVVIGFAFYPFLQYLNTDIPLPEIKLYYWIFQGVNVIGYICAYRESYVVACQHERKLIIINLIITIISRCVQIVVVLLTSNFLLYLSVDVVFTIGRKILLNIYIIRNYPETNLKGAKSLPSADKKIILRKTMAMLVHKIGNLAINQTDSLVVSYVGNVSQWGLVSNYMVLKRLISSVFDKIYGAMMPSMGNLIASEGFERKNRVFSMYDLANFWFCSFCFIGLSVLSSPFISIYLGPEVLLDDIAVFFFCFAFLVDGLRAPVSMMREASGAFEKDKWFTIVAAVVNLVISIVGAHFWGVAGVFVGTVCSMLVLHIARVILLFSSGLYAYTPARYFKRLAYYTLISLIGYAMTAFVVHFIGASMGIHIGSFLLMLLVVAVLPNGFYWFIFRNDSSFLELKKIAFARGAMLFKRFRKDDRNEE